MIMPRASEVGPPSDPSFQQNEEEGSAPVSRSFGTRPVTRLVCRCA
jgi:hypothetical protein